MKQANYMKYSLMVLTAVFLSFELHEFCHYLAGELSGNKMGFTLNSAFPVAGYYLHEQDYMIVSAAGPAFTIIQAVVFYFILRRRNYYYLYPVLFIPFFMRFSAMIISFRHPNDEARISDSLGIGFFTLPLIVSGFLFFLLYKISRQYDYSKRFQLVSFFFVLFFYSALILTDKYFHIRIL